MKTLLIALLFLPAIASASDTWQSGEYRYDGAGNIIGIGNDLYVYDPVSRLSHSFVNTANESYVYDAFGNLVTKTTDGRLETVPPVDSSTNRVTTASYDTAGNMTSSGDATYVYDPLNMMVRIDTSYARRRYIYTVDDERIGVQTDPTFTRWTVRDFGGKVLREFRADSINAWTWTEDYIYRDGQLVAAEQPGTSGGLRHFSLDHLGTTRLITNTPANGETPVAYGRHDFFPFGMEQTPTNQEVVNHSAERPEAMKFTGHQRDFLGDWYTDNSDYLDYMHARYYNPVMGRFLSVDRVVGVRGRPHAWNRYAYASNNPLLRIDPDGLTDIIITIQREPEVTVTQSGKGHQTTMQGTPGTYIVSGGKTNLSGYTLERADNGNQKEGRIPAGTYDGDVHQSPSLNRDVVGVLNVPNRSDILIHQGNEPENSTGCILVAGARDTNTNRITSSGTALDGIIQYINDVKAEDAKNKEATTIHVVVTDPPPPPPLVPTP